MNVEVIEMTHASYETNKLIIIFAPYRLIMQHYNDHVLRQIKRIMFFHSKLVRNIDLLRMKLLLRRVLAPCSETYALKQINNNNNNNSIAKSLLHNWPVLHDLRKSLFLYGPSVGYLNILDVYIIWDTLIYFHLFIWILF